jgi:hypothetical protein
VRDEAVQPRGGGPRRAARGETRAHARLHEQERREHADQAEEQRRPQGRLAHPVDAGHREQQRREADADQVVRAPADRSFAVHGRGRRDAPVPEAAARHVRDPASHQAEVRGGHAEPSTAQQRPQVGRGRRADADQGCTRQMVHLASRSCLASIPGAECHFKST